MFKTEKKCGVYLNETAPAQLPGKERRVKKKKRCIFACSSDTRRTDSAVGLPPVVRFSLLFD